MTAFSFRTIKASATGSYKEKGSKFLAFAYPVQSEQDVNNQLEKTRKAYFDARHHCYAFMLGPDRNKYRAFDDGEPNHSAGDPILGQIRAKHLTNILVIVVRYFGGVKLGVGGLIQAYKAAAEDCLSHASIIEKEVEKECEIEYDYVLTPDVMRMVKEFEVVINDQAFEGACRMKFSFKLRNEMKLNERLKELERKGARRL